MNEMLVGTIYIVCHQRSKHDSSWYRLSITYSIGLESPSRIGDTRYKYSLRSGRHFPTSLYFRPVRKTEHITTEIILYL